VMWITDSDFPMSSMTGRASLLLTTSTGGGVHAGIKCDTASHRNLVDMKVPLTGLIMAFLREQGWERPLLEEPITVQIRRP
ncbi:hypothetical protein ETR_06465, partial [Erwinia tracheiphila PSU-1]